MAKKRLLLFALLAGVLVAVLTLYHRSCCFGDNDLHFVSVRERPGAMEICVASNTRFSLRLRDPEGKTIFEKVSQSNLLGYRHEASLTVERDPGKTVLDGIVVDLPSSGPLEVGNGLTVGRGVGKNLYGNWPPGWIFYWGP